jgi:hypothetical protein
MTLMIVELYDALKEAGASEDKARNAARTVSDNDIRLAKIEGETIGIKGEVGGLRSQIDGLKMRIDALTWVVGLNMALSLAILVKLFIQ